MVDRPAVQRLQRPRQAPRARGDRRRLRALGGAGAAADDRRGAAAQRLPQQLRADQVHMAVDRARGEDPPVPGHDLGGCTDHERRVDAVHRVGVSGSADPADAPIADADVGFDGPPVVEDRCAGDDEVGGAFGAGRSGLAHRLADARTAWRSGGGTVQPRRGSSSGPATSPRRPAITRRPASGTNSTSIAIPGSNRTAVPAGTASR